MKMKILQVNRQLDAALADKITNSPYIGKDTGRQDTVDAQSPDCILNNIEVCSYRFSIMTISMEFTECPKIAGG